MNRERRPAMHRAFRVHCVRYEGRIRRGRIRGEQACNIINQTRMFETARLKRYTYRAVYTPVGCLLQGYIDPDASLPSLPIAALPPWSLLLISFARWLVRRDFGQRAYVLRFNG